MQRRYFLAATLAASTLTGRIASAQDFSGFLANIARLARREGIRTQTIELAFRGLQPDETVLKLAAAPPELTLTWPRYSSLILSPTRIANGRRAFADYRTVLAAVTRRFPVDPRIIVGIWGIESNYGTNQGDFRTIQALATLAWSGDRTEFFRNELIDALRIVNNNAIPPTKMLGSYAGAMGQPQFMPSVYLRLAVDFSGRGRPDIWHSTADSLASIANYLVHAGWRPGEPWGEAVLLPDRWKSDPDHDDPPARPIAAWLQMGIRRLPGAPHLPPTTVATLILPRDGNGAAFLVYPNFYAVRRYNPSDFYALSVGLLGDAVAS